MGSSWGYHGIVLKGIIPARSSSARMSSGRTQCDGCNTSFLPMQLASHPILNDMCPWNSEHEYRICRMSGIVGSENEDYCYLWFCSSVSWKKNSLPDGYYRHWIECCYHIPLKVCFWWEHQIPTVYSLGISPALLHAVQLTMELWGE